MRRTTKPMQMQVCGACTCARAWALTTLEGKRAQTNLGVIVRVRLGQVQEIGRESRVVEKIVEAGNDVRI